MQTALRPARTSATPPAIGQPWPEQGGVYAGISRGAPGAQPHHLIVATATLPRLTWGKARRIAGADCEWDGLANTRALVAASSEHPAAQACAELQIDGHADFYLPARRELAMCFANVPELFKPLWHWSSTQDDASYAWGCYFDNGYQSSGHKSYEGCAVAVRRLVLQSFDNSGEGGAP